LAEDLTEGNEDNEETGPNPTVVMSAPESPGTRVAQRLGNNRDGYLGEGIDIARVLADCRTAAESHGWELDRMPATPGPELLAFRRRARNPDSRTRNVYLSAGIHGDEPASPLAMRELLRADAWPASLNLWLCPCLNPTGFGQNRRENAEGLDLNRQYLNPEAAETLAHIAWLEQQPRFDLCLCLHEDWESHGFYLYELNPNGQHTLAETMIAAAGKACPIDPSAEIEGRPAQGGIIRPSVDPQTRPQWPEAFYLLQYKTRLSYTLEAPSDFPMPARVAGLVAAVRAGLEQFIARATGLQL
jgi:hypothetical protein